MKDTPTPEMDDLGTEETGESPVSTIHQRDTSNDYDPDDPAEQEDRSKKWRNKPPGRAKAIRQSMAPTAEGDPLSSAFGPGSGVFSDPEEDTDAPEELVYAFAEHGLSEKSYRCMLKQVNTESGNNSVVASFASHYPSVDWLRKNVGPGDYKMVFMWRTKNSEGKNKTFKTETINISISEKCRQDYLDYQLQTRLERLSKNRQKIRDAQLEKLLEMQAGEVDIDSKSLSPQASNVPVEDYVKKTLDMAKQLGWNPVGQVQPGIQWDKVLPVVISGLPIIMKLFSDGAARRDQQNQQMITLLTSMSSNSNSQLVELVKAQQGPTSGQQAIKEFTDMIRQAFDIKEMLAPQKEGIADKLFRLVEVIGPQIANVIALKADQRQQDPRYVMAQQYMTQSPDFKALKADPAEQIKFVNHLDEFYGWEQADMIMSVGQMERPQACPRDPVKRYPQGDEKNNNVGANGNSPVPQPETEESNVPVS